MPLTVYRDILCGGKMIGLACGRSCCIHVCYEKNQHVYQGCSPRSSKPTERQLWRPWRHNSHTCLLLLFKRHSKGWGYKADGGHPPLSLCRLLEMSKGNLSLLINQLPIDGEITFVSKKTGSPSVHWSYLIEGKAA